MSGYYNVEVWSIRHQTWDIITMARYETAKDCYDRLKNNGMSPRMRRVM